MEGVGRGVDTGVIVGAGDGETITGAGKEVGEVVETGTGMVFVGSISISEASITFKVLVI